MGEFGKQASVIIKTVRSGINVLDFYVQYNQNYKANRLEIEEAAKKRSL